MSSQQSESINTPPADENADLNGALNAGSEAEFITGGEEKSPQTTQYTILAGLVLVALAATYWMYFRKGPASASASATEMQQPAAMQTARSFLDSGQDGLRLMRDMLKSTEKVVKEFLAYPSMAQVPLNDLKTNPFRASQTGADGGSSDKRKRDEERQTVLKAVQGLHLQSIVSGTKKACMINNTLYTEGAQINQFTVEKISAGTVIVKSGTFRFELKMQK